MNWFKKLFASEANDKSKDAVTSQELGDYLFELCLRHVLSFLDGLDQPHQKMAKVNRKDINQIELMIAFMWSYFDLLQENKYLKALTRMHTCFMSHMTKLNVGADQAWSLLQKRYDDYRKCHRSQGAIDSTYQKAASEICKNILDLDIPNINLFLELSVTVTLQQNILNIGRSIKSKPIKDA